MQRNDKIPSPEGVYSWVDKYLSTKGETIINFSNFIRRILIVSGIFLISESIYLLYIIAYYKLDTHEAYFLGDLSGFIITPFGAWAIGPIGLIGPLILGVYIYSLCILLKKYF